MAAIQDQDKNEDLMCPICLDLLDDATVLLCGHTFCRKCLEEYDNKSHKSYKDLECPVCKEFTPLGRERVKGLTRNITVRKLVDKLEHEEKQVSLIKQMTKLCLTHDENETMYCKNCNMTVCVYCMANDHHDHDLTKTEDVEKVIRQRVRNLAERCKETKATIDKEIQICEEHRIELYSSAHSVESQMNEAFAKKATLPLDKKTKLMKRTKSIQEIESNKLDRDVAHHRKVIADIDKLFSYLEISSKTVLDGSSIEICKTLSDELDDLLTEESSFQEATEAASDGTVNRLQFMPASVGIPALGTVRLRREKKTSCPRYSEGSPISQEPSGAAGSSSSSGMKDFLTPIKVVSLSGSVQGMTALSDDTVLVGYGSKKNGSECKSVTGKSEQYLPPAVGEVWDIARLPDGKIAVSEQSHTIRLFHSDGSPTDLLYRCRRGNYFLRICCDTEGNIYAVNGNPEIYIFRGLSAVPDETISIGDIKPEQICVMKGGAMVVNTRGSKPGVVTVFDANGHVMTSVTANHSHEHLYAAVDTLNRLYIASVRLWSDCLTLSMYNLQDGILDKLFDSMDIPLSRMVENMAACSLVCLTPTLLAFARQYKLYFIEVIS